MLCAISRQIYYLLVYATLIRVGRPIYTWMLKTRHNNRSHVACRYIWLLIYILNYLHLPTSLHPTYLHTYLNTYTITSDTSITSYCILLNLLKY
jgi:hypothetical protein